MQLGRFVELGETFGEELSGRVRTADSPRQGVVIPLAVIVGPGTSSQDSVIDIPHVDREGRALDPRLLKVLEDRCSRRMRDPPLQDLPGSRNIGLWNKRQSVQRLQFRLQSRILVELRQLDESFPKSLLEMEQTTLDVGSGKVCLGGVVFCNLEVAHDRVH